MGCDIHMYIEYAKKEDDSSKEIRWRDFGGRINPGRNYRLFGIMSAGVRTDSEFNYEAKGIPDGLAYASRNDHLMYISDKENDEYVTLELARSWEKYGCKIINDSNGNPTWVENPDHHSHSWLTTDEYEKALKFYNDNAEPGWVEPEYEAVLASMKRFEELGYNSRIVFWFDN